MVFEKFGCLACLLGVKIHGGGKPHAIHVLRVLFG